MICVNIRGGLGNQLFQYAFMRHIQELKFRDVTIDISFFSDEKLEKRQFGLHRFNTKYEVLQQLPEEEFELFSEEGYTDLFLLRSPIYLVGYWQDLKYYDYVINDLYRECTLKQEYILPEMETLSKKMQDCNSVSLHIRRTDYLNPVNSGIFAQCSLEYYKNAVKMLKEKTNEMPDLYIFSDDIPFIRENAGSFEVPEERIHIVDTGNDYSDLYMMTQTRHSITANSSFSWWGAFTNIHRNDPDRIVISPSKWFVDGRDDPNIIMPGWLRIDP